MRPSYREQSSRGILVQGKHYLGDNYPYSIEVHPNKRNLGLRQTLCMEQNRFCLLRDHCGKNSTDGTHICGVQCPSYTAIPIISSRLYVNVVFWCHEDHSIYAGTPFICLNFLASFELTVQLNRSSDWNWGKNDGNRTVICAPWYQA